jgi:hypothetical protein
VKSPCPFQKKIFRTEFQLPESMQTNVGNGNAKYENAGSNGNGNGNGSGNGNGTTGLKKTKVSTARI